MKRVIAHWTAGSHNVGKIDKKHYHFIVSGEGSVVKGNHPVSHNAKIIGSNYAMHTRKSNTGSIGISCASMHGATERPLSFGKYPLTEVQFEAMCKKIAMLCKQYTIPISSTTTLTHAEVQPNLGVKQRGKWDIAYLKFRPELKGAKDCGRYMRRRIKWHYDELYSPAPEPVIRTARPTDKLVSKRKPAKGIIAAIVVVTLPVIAQATGVWGKFILWIGF